MIHKIPEISVIIPTYHDWGRLKLCLEELTRQSIDAFRFEVIVVNNDPDDRPPTEFELPINFKLIEESKPGSYAARNAALRIARGKVIAFTDSDCIPSPDWLLKGLEYLADGADRVAGRVELFFKEGGLTWAEIYEKAFTFKQHKFAALGVSVTANLITWREVLEEVGYFNENLMSGGDFEWNRRATAMKKSIVFGENCTVFHPARANFSELKKRCRRIAGGTYSVYGIQLSDVLRGPMPPVNILLGLVQDKKLVMREKIIAFMVCYMLKIYRLHYVLKFWIGLESPNRFKQ